MPINLSQPSEQTQTTFHKKRQLVDTGVLISIGIIILVVLTFAGLKFYNKILNDKIVAADKQMENDLAYLNGSSKDAEVYKVADFYHRLAKAGENISLKPDPKSPLVELEKTVVKGVTLNSYAYDKAKNSVALTAQADSFPTIARQLLSFKKAERFSEVKISGISKADQAKINFSIEMSIVK